MFLRDSGAGSLNALGFDRLFINGKWVDPVEGGTIEYVRSRFRLVVLS